MKVDLARLQRTLEAARSQYPVVGRVLDGKATREDMGAFAKAARALGLTDVADGVELAIKDPAAMVKALGAVGPELAQLFGEGMQGLDELAKIDNIINAFRGR